MTLVIALATQDLVLQVSDMRFTYVDGRAQQYDERNQKALVVTGIGFAMTVGVSGAVSGPGFSMLDLLYQYLEDSAAPLHDAQSIVYAFRERLTEAFASVRRFWDSSVIDHLWTSVLFSGWRGMPGKGLPFHAVVTNHQDCTGASNLKIFANFKKHRRFLVHWYDLPPNAPLLLAHVGVVPVPVARGLAVGGALLARYTGLPARAIVPLLNRAMLEASNDPRVGPDRSLSIIEPQTKPDRWIPDSAPQLTQNEFQITMGATPEATFYKVDGIEASMGVLTPTRPTATTFVSRLLSSRAAFPDATMSWDQGGQTSGHTWGRARFFSYSLPARAIERLRKTPIPKPSHSRKRWRGP